MWRRFERQASGPVMEMLSCSAAPIMLLQGALRAAEGQS
jgi:hypothetical protein